MTFQERMKAYQQVTGSGTTQNPSSPIKLPPSVAKPPQVVQIPPPQITQPVIKPIKP